MDRGELSTLTSRDNVTVFSTGNVETGDVVLVDRPVFQILVAILVFLDSSEVLLLARAQILDDSKCSCWKDNLVVILAEVAHSLVAVSRVSIDVIDLVGVVGLGWVTSDTIWCLLVDLLKEELFSLLLWCVFVWHFSVKNKDMNN